jgi:hypothetical protein
MCVALAGQLILWTISNDNPPVKKEPSFCAFSVAQAGVDHLLDVSISADGRELFFADSSEIRYRLSDGSLKSLPPTDETKVVSEKGLEVAYFRQLNPGEDSAWAGQIALTLSHFASPLELRLHIERCGVADVHYLTLDCLSSVSAFNKTLLFTEKGDLKTALSAENAKLRQLKASAFGDGVPTDANAVGQRVQLLDDSVGTRTIILPLSRTGRIEPPKLDEQAMHDPEALDLLTELRTTLNSF